MEYLILLLKIKYLQFFTVISLTQSFLFSRFWYETLKKILMTLCFVYLMFWFDVEDTLSRRVTQVTPRILTKEFHLRKRLLSTKCSWKIWCLQYEKKKYENVDGITSNSLVKFKLGTQYIKQYVTSQKCHCLLRSRCQNIMRFS